VFDNYLCAEQANVYECRLTLKQRDYYWKLIHEHYYQGWSCSYEAESGCTNIPNRVYKVASKSAIAAITAGIISRNISSTAIATVTAALQESLEQFGSVWERISCNLHCAAYNVEMAEFYQDVLAADG
jgi:hypothetical protein